MIAIIPAAGFGTRIASLPSVPKPLIKINGRTIIERIIEKIKDIGIKDIIIETNKRDYSLFLEALKHLDVKIIHNDAEVVEKKLGAMGDFNFALKHEKVDDDVLLIGADNIFECSLHEPLNLFKSSKKDLLLFYDVLEKEKAKRFGIALFDENNRIINFEEKPQNPKSTLCSASTYFFRKDTIKLVDTYLKENPPDNLGSFIPWLMKKKEVYGFVVKGRWFDIGTKETLAEAEKYFRD